MSPLHMNEYDLIRSEGPSICSVRLTTNTVPGILVPHSSFMMDMLICFFFFAHGGRKGALNDIWSLCGASLFKSGNQRPPMCYTSNVVRGGGGGGGICRFGSETHLKSWSSPTKSMLADGTERSSALWSTPALATHWASTDNVYHPVLLLTTTFFSLRHSFPLWQAGLSVIVLCMTDAEWGLALIQGRPCTTILWFLSTSLADVWWWHIWQKPIQGEGLGGVLCG